jgi:CMP-N-acetylneuraminate monooxygenase
VIHQLSNKLETDQNSLIELKLSNLNEGLNVTDLFFIKKNNNKIEWVVNRICDHDAGKLLLTKDKKAKCPLHGWVLNLSSLKYENVLLKKKKLNFYVKKNILFIETKEKRFNQIDNNKNNSNEKITMRYLSHATILLSYKNINLITDPWLFGSAFNTGWWLKREPTKDIEEIISKVNYIYISHNHPDHLHIRTLNKFSKDTIIITPNFKSSSSYKILNRLGFKNIKECDFKKYFYINDENFLFSVLKSGDFREDSGLYIQVENTKILFNVDSNNLNSGVLPEQVDFAFSSFASGASGFPLCYKNYSKNEKRRILKKHKEVKLLSVLNLVKKTNPKVFLPYAGHFKEFASRDKIILKNNQKNNYDDVKNFFNKHKIKSKIIDLEKNDNLIFKDKKLKVENLYIGNKIKKEKIDEEVILFKKLNDTKNYIKLIRDYFLKSDFNANLVLFLNISNDNFKQIENSFFIDFSEKKIKFKKIDLKKVDQIKQNLKPSLRYIQITARKDSLIYTINNKLPFEDLLIGFQVQVFRKPNLYNTDFWHHFTNVYIDGSYFKYDKLCGSCEALNQQLY